MLLAVYWPLRATVDATWCVVRFGARAEGTSRVSQWLQMMRLAHLDNYSPRTYYLYRLWAAGSQAATGFVQLDEMMVVQATTLKGRDLRTLVDKEAFERACSDAALPCVNTVASVHSATANSWSGVLPRTSLFVKQAWGSQGAGAERWVYDPAIDRWSRRSDTKTHDDLVAHVRSMARWHHVIIQECLSNHADVARFSTGSLCTFRVMTYDNASPRLLGLVLKMARAGSDADNLHAGGLVAWVDPDTGRLGPGLNREWSSREQATHPDTGEPVAGNHLDTHGAVIELALRAQAHLDVPWSVGWDIAMTPCGPVLVEGNSHWGVDLYHIPRQARLDEAFARDLLTTQVRPARASMDASFTAHT